MIGVENWTAYERLEFKNKNLGAIDLTSCQALSNSENVDFNTELLFDNCQINSFNASVKVLGKPITFINCKVGSLWCYATYFFGGLKMVDTIIEETSTFGCGVHNITPSKFVLDGCVFNEYLDFFDVYFDGPVEIVNNDFKKGTNIGLYLAVPYGIKEGVPYTVEKNKGQLNKHADNALSENKN